MATGMGMMATICCCWPPNFGTPMPPGPFWPPCAGIMLTGTAIDCDGCCAIIVCWNMGCCCPCGGMPPLPPCGPCGPTLPPGAWYIGWYICCGFPGGRNPGALVTTKPGCIIGGPPPPGPMAPMGGPWSGCCACCCHPGPGTGPPGTPAMGGGRLAIWPGFGWPSISRYDELPFASGHSGSELSRAAPFASWKKGSRMSVRFFRDKSGFLFGIANCGTPVVDLAAGDDWDAPTTGTPGVKVLAWGLKANDFDLLASLAPPGYPAPPPCCCTPPAPSLRPYIMGCCCCPNQF
mmetsp:Transcript_48904/g.138175  ORF Transcript_48904/g.138175 Transcript_48904/m.138175 type:complete len:291 (+) Transcript_48904:305-1177(+)